MRLIITEKNDAAKKIAGILAKGGGQGGSYLEGPLLPLHRRRRASRARAWVSRATWCRWTSRPSTPSGARWSPGRSSTLPLVKTETAKSVVRAVKKLAADASTLIIATDFDREGELIGLEALNLAVEENAKLVRTVRRARFSALTPGEINRAFANLDQLSEPLARAGEARQDIDLIWGATLTRFVSLATSRLGSQFLSVGRVQTPTLVLVAEREKERRAFVSEPFWVVKVELDADGQTVQRRPQGRALHRRGPGDGRLREARHPGPGHRRQADLAQGAAAGALQHHQLHQRGHLARASAPRRPCASPRISTWRGTSATRVPTTPSTRRPSTCARRWRYWPRASSAREAGAAAGAGRRCIPAGATSGPPTTRPSIPPAVPAGASWATGSGASTSWWPGASWPPWPTRRSWSPTGSTWR